MNINSLTDITIGGIDTNDYPDFCDAFVDSAHDADGVELNDEQLLSIPSDDITNYIHDNQCYTT